MKKVKINLPVFNWRVRVYLLDDMRDIKTKEISTYLKMTGQHNFGSSIGIHASKNSKSIIIILPNNNRNATIVHELMHCVDSICEHHGIRDTETRALLIDYLYRKII